MHSIASVMKDEQGRPFIVVREYVKTYKVGKSWEIMVIFWGKIELIMLQSRQKEEATRQRCSKIPHPGRPDSREHRADLVGKAVL